MMEESISKKIISFSLIFIFLSIPVLAQAPQAPEDYLEGRKDGERDAKGSAGWIAGGVLCGIFTVIYVYAMSKPSPPATALIGKTQDYVLGYTEGYQKKTRSKNGMYALLGWTTWIVIYFAVTSGNQSTSIY